MRHRDPSQSHWNPKDHFRKLENVEECIFEKHCENWAPSSNYKRIIISITSTSAFLLLLLYRTPGYFPDRNPADIKTQRLHLPLPHTPVFPGPHGFRSRVFLDKPQKSYLMAPDRRYWTVIPVGSLGFPVPTPQTQTSTREPASWRVEFCIRR